MLPVPNIATDTIRQVQLYLHEYHRAELVDPFHVDFNVEWKHHAQALMFQVTRGYWGLSNKKAVTVQWPADWWQHFKQRWFPTWALRRWPIQFTVKQWDAITLAPELYIPDNRGERHGKRHATISIFEPSSAIDWGRQ